MVDEDEKVNSSVVDVLGDQLDDRDLADENDIVDVN